MYFPKNVRFARTFDRPYMGMTARFHKSWADFGGIKPYAALEYETRQMMAHGARCSIGDQLHPRGYLDQASYDLIGKAYERVEQREPWLVDAKPISQICLFRAPTKQYHSAGSTDDGATRMLTQLKHLFDVVNDQSSFDRYKLLILPDAIPVSADLARKLQAYVKAGGSLLLSGTSGMTSDATEPSSLEHHPPADARSPVADPSPNQHRDQRHEAGQTHHRPRAAVRP